MMCFGWPSCCLFFVIPILITPLVSSNSSYGAPNAILAAAEYCFSVLNKYMLSGCELIDTENISLPSQIMKFGGE